MIPKAHDNNIEGIRGIAALTVVFGHIFYYKDLIDPNFSAELIGGYIPPAHLSVLAFFCLSGYVIGLSNKRGLSNRYEIVIYLKKRFIRLYPIYVISILFCLPFMNFPMEWKDLAANLTFTQNIFGDTIKQNNPLWSLNYEVIYYLIFIPVSYFRITGKKTFIAILVIVLINFIIYPYIKIPSLLSSYLFGFGFWAGGVMLSELSIKKRSRQVSNNLLISILCLFLLNKGLEIIPIPVQFNNYFHVPFWAIVTRDWLAMPFCFYLLLIFSNIEFPFRRIFTALIYCLPGIYFISCIILIPGNYLTRLLIPLLLYMTSLCLLIMENKKSAVSNKIMSVLISLGSISYAMYVMHFPILSYFHSIDYFSGTFLSVSVRLILFLILLFSISIFLEKYLQPKIKRAFFR